MQRELQSDRLKKLTRLRFGVEAVPSQLRRKQKIVSIPVMGRVRKKFWYLMDLMAINVRRIIRFEKQRSENGPKLCFSRFSVSRKQKIDSIPVMGRVRKKIWYLMDLMAINVRRIIRFEKQRSENGPKLFFSRFSVSALVNLLLQITNNLAVSEKSSYRCSFLLDIS